jgi:tetratricopeptide (TPR) repeat protein
VPKDAAAAAWVGKTVFRKHTTVQLVTVDAAGTERPTGPTAVSYRVVADEGERVRVIQEGRPAWFKKAEVVRAEDAVAHFTRLLKEEPNNAAAWLLYRGSAHGVVGQVDDGIKDYDTLIARYPTGAVYWNNRASLKVTAKRYDGAIADLDRALALVPNYPIALRNRGWAKMLKKDYDAAIADLDKAIDAAPAVATGYVYRGECRGKKGQFDLAAKDLAEAVRLEPLSAAALNARAWFLATVPDDKLRDGPAAVKLIGQACDLSDWKTGSYLDTLAAASAACGKFDDAVRYEEAALRDKKFAEQSSGEAKARLELYKQGKPYRQEVSK